MAFFPEEAAGADLLISWSADCRLTADGVLVHLNVKDSQVTLRGICVNGGKIVCPKIEIEVDGNVSFENAKKMAEAGADIFVAGTSSIFNENLDLDEGIKKLREAIN